MQVLSDGEKLRTESEKVNKIMNDNKLHHLKSYPALVCCALQTPLYAGARGDLPITWGLMWAIKGACVAGLEGVHYIWPPQQHCISACCHLG